MIEGDMKTKTSLQCFLLLVFVVFPAAAVASTVWIADVSWYFDAISSTKTYHGVGYTQGDAFNVARQHCFAGQASDAWRASCATNPTKIEFREAEDCGRHWSGWKEIGQAVGSPCPKGCVRDQNPIAQDFRFVGFPPRPQHKDKFQCFRTEPVESSSTKGEYVTPQSVVKDPYAK
jgi:hypothetical protein